MPDHQDHNPRNLRVRLEAIRHHVGQRFAAVRRHARSHIGIARHRAASRFAGPGRRVAVAVALLLGFAVTAVAANAALLPDTGSSTVAVSQTAAPLDEKALLDRERAVERSDRSHRTEAGGTEVVGAEAAGTEEEAPASAAGSEEPAARADAPAESPAPQEPQTAEATATEKAQPDWVHPMPGARTTSCYGPRWGGMHQGVDLAMPHGTPIRAVGAGTVVNAGWVFGGYGISVVIDHHNGFLTHYAHASRANVSVGDRVTPGQVIALEGSTGDSTGPHLHLEVHRGRMWNQIEPTTWLRERGVSIGGC